jgi:DNA-binding MarR family transcriptional regulator
MVTRAVTQRYDTMLRPIGLRITQYSVLANIARAGESTLDQLTEVMAIDQTTLTRSLTLLEQAGLIKRVPHPDKRTRSLQVTRKGIRALSRARPLWARAQAQILQMIGEGVWGKTRRGLTRLLAATAGSKLPEST